MNSLSEFVMDQATYSMLCSTELDSSMHIYYIYIYRERLYMCIYVSNSPAGNPATVPRVIESRIHCRFLDCLFDCLLSALLLLYVELSNSEGIDSMLEDDQIRHGLAVWTIRDAENHQRRS